MDDWFSACTIVNEYQANEFVAICGMLWDCEEFIAFAS